MTLLTLFRGGATTGPPIEPPIITPPNPSPSGGTPFLLIIQDVCAVVGVIIPSTVFGNQSDRTMQEMIKHGNEMARRIAYDTRDWTMLRKQQTYYGNGTTTAFYLPTDFKRMLLNSNVWRSTDVQAPMRFIPDTDEWLQRRAQGYYDNRGEWTMMGGQMHIEPPLGINVTARYAYLEKNCIVSADGTRKDAFTADSDMYRLDARLLTLGIIYDWKMNKGSPYAEDMGTYGDCLANVAGADSPSPIIMGRMPLSAHTRVAYPWTLPTP